MNYNEHSELSSRRLPLKSKCTLHIANRSIIEVGKRLIQAKELVARRVG